MNKRAFLIAQIIASVAVIIFGLGYAIRCLIANEICCAAGFALIGYGSGYRYLFKASLKELREYRSEELKS